MKRPELHRAEHSSITPTAATLNITSTKVFLLVADLGANYSGNAHRVYLGNTTFEYLFGPRFNWRHSRFTPYMQSLVGGERFSSGLNPASTSPRRLTSQNNFAAALGGGLLR